MSEITVTTLDFEFVQQYWLRTLWKGRRSPIQPTSSLTRDIEIDLSLKNARAYFWGAQSPQGIIGVLSGFETGKGWFRLRGLYVEEGFRKQGIGQLLLESSYQEARRLNCHSVWTLPRHSAKDFYSRAGFEFKGPWFEEKMEFGPNCYADRKI